MMPKLPTKTEFTRSDNKIFVDGVHSYSIVEERDKYYVAPVLGRGGFLSTKKLIEYDLSNEKEAQKWFAEFSAKCVKERFAKIVNEKNKKMVKEFNKTMKIKIGL